MPRIPRIDTEEGNRLYREYVVETAKTWVGYGGILIGSLGLFAWRVSASKDKGILAVFFVALAIGLASHFWWSATKEAAKIRLETKRRYPPPPVESHNAGGRPEEVRVAGYNVRFKDEQPKDD